MSKYECNVCHQYEVVSVDIPTLCEHCGNINGTWKNLDTDKIEQVNPVRSKIIHKSIPDDTFKKKKPYVPKPIHKPKVVPKPKVVAKPKIITKPKVKHPVKHSPKPSPSSSYSLYFRKMDFNDGIKKMFFRGLGFLFLGFLLGIGFSITFWLNDIHINAIYVIFNWTVFTGMFGAVTGFIKGYKG